MKFTALILTLWAALVMILVNSRLQSPWLVAVMATITVSYLALLYAARNFIRRMSPDVRGIVYAVTVLFAVVDLWVTVLLFSRI